MICLYISSGRRRKENYPVEDCAALNVGDVVRIKDAEWLESLEKDLSGTPMLKYGDGFEMYFPDAMKEFLGMEVEIIEVSTLFRSEIPRYRVKTTDGKWHGIGSYSFTNDMLEYI